MNEELRWLNKPVESSKHLILKEAFKLFLQYNFEKVTVPELEQVTQLRRGAIFYHFKDKSAIFEEVIEKFFFSPLNIFYPIAPEQIVSLKSYYNKKCKHVNEIQLWFEKEKLSTNIFGAFFHLTEQADLYLPTFKENMQTLLNTNKQYWIQVVLADTTLTFSAERKYYIGDILDSFFIAQCFKAYYNNKSYLNNIPNSIWNWINEISNK